MFRPGREDLQRRGSDASGVRALGDAAAALLGQAGGSVQSDPNEPEGTSPRYPAPGVGWVKSVVPASRPGPSTRGHELHSLRPDSPVRPSPARVRGAEQAAGTLGARGVLPPPAETRPPEPEPRRGSLPYLTGELAPRLEPDEAAAREAEALEAAGSGRPAPARTGGSPLLGARAGLGRGRRRRPSRDVLPAGSLLGGEGMAAASPRRGGKTAAQGPGCESGPVSRGGSGCSARAAAACAAEGGVGSAGRGLERVPPRGRRAPVPSRLRGHRRARPSAAATSRARQVSSLHVEPPAPGARAFAELSAPPVPRPPSDCCK
ncbi:skin secretory protein xP2-like [Rhinolophus ferrumequinum]|uniref:skin secretory protein xP2-like n=1 Tax=Rhinolophus ferrumequinum TaxID=59479 RepID=UPI00140F5B4A|nr:skin secretory protein xP2-like [Rhinolophus ferrumequinum]